MRNRLNFILFLLSALTFMSTSCSREHKAPPFQARKGILMPLTETTDSSNSPRENYNRQIGEPLLPLVNPGPDFSIVTLLDGNLDQEQSDEQIIIALPINNQTAPMKIMLASTDRAKNEYGIIWTHNLSSRTFRGLTLRADDVTGNGSRDIIVAGFDDTGRHVTDIFSKPAKRGVESFKPIFNQVVNGNIDIETVDRMPDYWSGKKKGLAYPIVVQQTDASSESSMDILETTWEWNAPAFLYRKKSSRRIQAEAISEERIARVYTGGAEIFEDYLKGAWYRETGNGAYEDMVYFNTDTREIMFYDGQIQEVFSWGTSHRTTAKKLYARINNAIIPALFDNLSISAEAWDQLYLARVVTPDKWDGTYRRLNSSLQDILDSQLQLSPLMESIPLTGIWRGSGGEELVIDLPSIEWKSEQSVRRGTASVFTLNGKTVLQVQFLKRNGAAEETSNWLMDFQEVEDGAQIIRFLTVTPAHLVASGIRIIDDNPRQFEQIEMLSP